MPNSYKCHTGLHKLIMKAMRKVELKPLLQVYYNLYGYLPDALCALYKSLP